MATWNSTPSVPHTGGTFNFPQNTTNNDIVYTIKYTDDNGCTASTTYTVPPCDCSVYEFSTITRPVTGHTTTSIAWSIDSLEQLTYTIMSSGGFLTGITIVHTSDRWQYMGEFNTTTSSSDRTATIEYKNSDGTCVFPQELVMKGETCTCSQIGVSVTELNISADSALTQVGVITTNDCVPNVTYESTQPTWLSGVTPHTNDIRIKCSENTTYNSRSGSVNVKMNGNTCVTVNVTQAGKAVDCTSYDFNKKSPSVNTGASSNVIIATSLKTDGGSTIPQLVFKSELSDDWVHYIGASEEVVGTKTLYNYKFNVDSNSGAKRTGTAIFETADGECMFSAGINQNGKDVNIVVSEIGTIVAGSITFAGRGYTATCTWNSEVKHISVLGTINTADTASNISAEGSVSYYTAQGQRGAIVHTNCGNFATHYLISAQWSESANVVTLYARMGTCQTT